MIRDVSLTPPGNQCLDVVLHTLVPAGKILNVYAVPHPPGLQRVRIRKRAKLHAVPASKRVDVDRADPRDVLDLMGVGSVETVRHRIVFLAKV